MNKLFPACVAEFLGTFALTFFGAGAIILTNADAVKPLGMSGAPGGLLTVALAHGLILFCFICGCGYISGAQFNPAVSLGACLAGKLKPVNAAFHVVAQLFGAACAAGMLQFLLTPEVANHAGPKLGATIGAMTTSGNLTGVIGIEAIMTFALVFVVLTAAVDERAGKLGPLAIGMTVTACILAAGPLTGASMNPARTFGPAICGKHWDMFHAYLIGPAIGAILAAMVYRMFWNQKA